MKEETRILHNAGSEDPATGALSVPIYPASTYRQNDIDVRQEFEYSRSGNPTRKALEETLALLENGAAGYAFASGVAAIFAALSAFLKQGDHVIMTENCYGGTYRLITDFFTRYGISHTFADTGNPEAVRSAVRPETRVLFLESPSNPMMRITQFREMVKIAKEKGIITMTDNTFLSPYFFKPLDLGIDISIHSATKFLGGHSDLLAGCVMTRTKELGKAVYFVQNACGGVLSPENSWLLLRGIKTLAVRMQAGQKNAFFLAENLKTKSWVKNIYYPGLKDHPLHAVISAEASGYGSVLSIETDSPESAKKLLKGVKIWSPAVSLGGVESIISYPFIMSHGAVPTAVKEKIGITRSLLRLSAGLEAPEDLLTDLEQALT